MPVGDTGRGGQVQVYRPGWFLMLVGWLAIGGFYIVALSGVVVFFGGAKNSGGVGGFIVALICLVGAGYVSWLAWIDCLVVSADGLAFLDLYRRRRVPWEAVAGFGTGLSEGMMDLPCVVVRLDERGGREVKQVIGTRRRAEQIAAELEKALQSYREA